jgi:hypothetical protein
MTIQEQLDDFDNEAEGANYHEFVGLAGEVYEEIKDFIPSEDDRNKAVEKICAALRKF